MKKFINVDVIHYITMITKENKTKRDDLIARYNRCRNKTSKKEACKILMQHEAYLLEIEENG